jgi:two-component system, NtrC family, response regulator
MANILVAEDERDIRLLIASLLMALGHDVIETADGRVALSLLQTMPLFDLLITDLRMPGVDGVQLIETCKTDYPEIQIIAISAYHEPLVEAQAKGAHYVIKKPFSHQQLVDLVQSLSHD